MSKQYRVIGSDIWCDGWKVATISDTVLAGTRDDFIEHVENRSVYEEMDIGY